MQPSSESTKSMDSTGAEVSAAGAGGLVQLKGLSFSYGKREALRDISFSIEQGELFGLLGPNGSGKSTLMRLLSGLMSPGRGTATIAGIDISTDPAAVRRHLGVAFQSPSLDKMLTVRENLRFQGYLYGIIGRRLEKRVAELLESFGLTGRRNERVGTLSGGLKRRVELAKALLHRPPVLLLDEPSNGLDPVARRDFWAVLDQLRSQKQLTVIAATHLMDEAERCGRIALLDNGRLVVVERPEVLRAEMGADVVTVETEHPAELIRQIQSTLNLAATLSKGTVRLEVADGLQAVRDLLRAFPDEVQAIRLGKPTLEDVFLARTGHHFENGEEQS